MQLSLYALGFATFILFISYTSGSIIAEIMKLRTKNPFANIALGFFSYFATLTILTFPLQLFSALPYVFFIYYTIVLSQLYLIVCVLLFRYWITSTFLSISSLIFVIVVVLIMSVNLFSGKIFGTGDFTSHKGTLLILDTFKNKPISFFNGKNPVNNLGYKVLQSWYALQMGMIIITKATPNDYFQLINSFNFIIDAFIVASIFMVVITRFNDVEHQGYRQFGVFMTIFYIIGLKFFLGYVGLKLFNEMTYFVYLIFYALTLLISYSNHKFREHNLPLVIGFILGSYISFSWENSYPIIFLLYAIVFALQRISQNNYTKDIIKISLFPLINLVFFNFFEKLYFQSAFFGAIVLLFFIVIYFMAKKYSRIIKFETSFDKNNNFFVLFLPLLFAGLSVMFILAAHEDLILMFMNYLSFIYNWTIFIEIPKARQWIALVLTIILLAFSLSWVFIRKNISTSKLSTISDLTAISFITFYNPLVIKFVSIIYKDFVKLNGTIMAVLFVHLACVGIYTLTNMLGNYLSKKTIAPSPKVRHKRNIYEIN
ncbi:hypothetical protein [Spiroplasma alleghenense]|uniref:Transmembrane protein n=1 Tax=Spiroplasma alleghenense TaxID=216931 RepID=A0A345Z2G3_9MOLU|nr:hypothetical protein [Spiroplasma alleghenense]AXK50792.1 hypothetical protein SALLE_v1c01160 [Spiroplasma alleghenense]